MLFGSNASPPIPEPSEIVELRVYPIKSCRGFTVEHSTVTMQGLDLDRRWMFVDAETMSFITIRDISKMTLVRTALSDDSSILSISLAETDPSVLVSIPAKPSSAWLAQNTTKTRCKVWGYDTDGFAYGSEINTPFSDFFGKKVALIYKGPEVRQLTGNGAKEHLGREQGVGFADVLPVTVASRASLQELNSRLREKGNEEDLTIERFRPNIIIKGNTPWEEDDWKLLRINGSASTSVGMFNTKALDLDVAARCARCQVPNVDPITAEKDAKEPWTTLVSYRRVDEGIKYKPCFGMLCCPRNEGDISVGMRFDVLKTTNEHRYIKGF